MISTLLYNCLVYISLHEYLYLTPPSALRIQSHDFPPISKTLTLPQAADHLICLCSTHSAITMQDEIKIYWYRKKALKKTWSWQLNGKPSFGKAVMASDPCSQSYFPIVSNKFTWEVGLILLEVRIIVEKKIKNI